ncbi:hypothetical protein FTZ77_22610 [Salmonella enterica]|uniref:Uncharacterized protein n=1 Tax=Salmonella enterica TaxID=28901 RepID=A0A5U6STF9_SALER|nr:hypothetical protein [Salmonella enterica]EDU1815500.1 hypothetical protein [Salmonella enterica subsp. enterica serovar Sandiego]EAU2296907.1 hypothetical protein [Salmonella enterica]EAU5655747.1 hypothetical protein [Salmonella enterica]EAV6213382.1 hypothetical protein [Salmonella enterica]
MSEQELKLGACYYVVKELVHMLPFTHYHQLVNNLNQRIDNMLKSDGFNNVETMMLKRYLDGLIR